MKHVNLTTGLIAGAFVVAALGACKKSGEYGTDTTAMRVDTAAGRMDTAGGKVVPTDSGTPTGKFADASVLGFATVASRGEVALGKLGEKMATNPQVKAFARMLVTDHQKLLSSTSQLSSKLSAPVDTTSGDASDLASHDMDEIKDLNGKTKGADWDNAFIDEVIQGHQKVLSGLQDDAKGSTNASVRSTLEKATGVFQQHLTKAQDIKTNVLKS
jgi:putative membrane protein